MWKVPVTMSTILSELLCLHLHEEGGSTCFDGVTCAHPSKQRWRDLPTAANPCNCSFLTSLYELVRACTSLYDFLTSLSRFWRPLRASLAERPDVLEGNIRSEPGLPAAPMSANTWTFLHLLRNAKYATNEVFKICETWSFILHEKNWSKSSDILPRIHCVLWQFESSRSRLRRSRQARSVAQTLRELHPM